MNTKQQQNRLLEAINSELAYEDSKRSSYRDSVYFYPAGGYFMYNDQRISHDVVQPLIDDGTLVYKGIEKHQLEQMPRYSVTS